MTGLEPRSSGVESNHSTNWAETTGLDVYGYNQMMDEQVVT